MALRPVVGFSLAGIIADAALPRRNMVDPVPTQCMMVDREFPRRPFNTLGFLNTVEGP